MVFAILLYLLDVFTKFFWCSRVYIINDRLYWFDQFPFGVSHRIFGSLICGYRFSYLLATWISQDAAPSSFQVVKSSIGSFGY
jgi:hypothetical protein